MRNPDMAKVSRVVGGICALVIAVLGVYLPMVGALDPALLPFLLAFTAFCVGDTAATYIEGRREGVDFLHSRSQLPRK